MPTIESRYTLNDVYWNMVEDCNKLYEVNVYDRFQDSGKFYCKINYIDPTKLTFCYTFNHKSRILLNSLLLFNNETTGLDDIVIYPKKTMNCWEIIQAINNELNKKIDFINLHQTTKAAIIESLRDNFPRLYFDRRDIRKCLNGQLRYRDILYYSRYFEGITQIAPNTYQVCYGIT